MNNKLDINFWRESHCSCIYLEGLRLVSNVWEGQIGIKNFYVLFIHTLYYFLNISYIIILILFLRICDQYKLNIIKLRIKIYDKLLLFVNYISLYLNH